MVVLCSVFARVLRVPRLCISVVRSPRVALLCHTLCVFLYSNIERNVTAKSSFATCRDIRCYVTVARTSSTMSVLKFYLSVFILQTAPFHNSVRRWTLTLRPPPNDTMLGKSGPNSLCLECLARGRLRSLLRYCSLHEIKTFD